MVLKKWDRKLSRLAFLTTWGEGICLRKNSTYVAFMLRTREFYCLSLHFIVCLSLKHSLTLFRVYYSQYFSIFTFIKKTFLPKSSQMPCINKNDFDDDGFYYDGEQLRYSKRKRSVHFIESVSTINSQKNYLFFIFC